MANTKDIQRRIKSVKSTRQITKAMELVSVSKMKRAQQSALNSQPFARLLTSVLVDLAPHLEELEHPYLTPRPLKTRGILLITTDKGLCGPLNSNLLRTLESIKTPAKFIAIGRKGTQYLARTGRPLQASFEVNDHVPHTQTRPVAEHLMALYESGEIDTIEIVYSHFKNTLVQTPVQIPLLPLGDLLGFIKKVTAQHNTQQNLLPLTTDTRPINFEPSPLAILNQLLPFYITREIRHAILIAKASEHSARMVAMKTAKDNATQLLDHLTLQYNKARQAAITNEILEISAAQFAAQS